VEVLFLAALVLLLLECLRRLRVVEAGVRRLLELHGIGQGPREPSHGVRNLALAGHVVEAMRLYREQSGADVKKARQVVDQLRREAASVRDAN
jgi:hypothetical protein